MIAQIRSRKQQQRKEVKRARGMEEDEGEMRRKMPADVCVCECV